MKDVENFKEFFAICSFYKDKTTKRSMIPLINHITEGVYILEKLDCCDKTVKAYCLHPIFQEDSNYTDNYYQYISDDPIVMTYVMEYRNIANAYLSTRLISDISQIKLSPIQEVNHMLIADKIQNRKDFEIYHKNHERYKELSIYFSNWFKALSISDNFYKEIVEDLKNVQV